MTKFFDFMIEILKRKGIFKFKNILFIFFLVDLLELHFLGIRLLRIVFLENEVRDFFLLKKNTQDNDLIKIIENIKKTNKNKKKLGRK
jgi:hypothetical protein